MHFKDHINGDWLELQVVHEILLIIEKHHLFNGQVQIITEVMIIFSMQLHVCEKRGLW